MRASLEQNEKKIEFIEANIGEYEYLFIRYRVNRTQRLHKQDEFKKFINKARVDLQYSCKTCDEDIIRFLYYTWCKMKKMKPF